MIRNLLRVARPRKDARLALMGEPSEALRDGLSEDGYHVLNAPVPALPTVVVAGRVPDSPLLRRLRAALGRRGRVVISCEASRIMTLWSDLRQGGLEPKHTVFVRSGDQILHAVVLARPGKPGGLTVQTLPHTESG